MLMLHVITHREGGGIPRCYGVHQACVGGHEGVVTLENQVDEWMSALQGRKCFVLFYRDSVNSHHMIGMMKSY